jgi:Xaa-Pro aminopeptidase
MAFDPSVYGNRRERLARDLGTGVAVFLGNGEAPMNYADNTYPFRQDATFLYFWALDRPDLAAVIDVDAGSQTIFLDEATIDEVIWAGPQAAVAEQAARAGVSQTAPRSALAETVRAAVAGGRPVHVLPPYRGEHVLRLADALGVPPAEVAGRASPALIRAIVAQRAVKSAAEIAEIEAAVAITRDMHLLAMRTARPGVYEREVAGAIEGLALARGGRLAFPVIFSVHGETLHNHGHANRMEAGQIAVNDSGAESASHYAGDITRTLPIGGRFVGTRRDLYQAVLRAQVRAIEAIRPGVPYRDVHLLACRSLAEDLGALGIVRGEAGAAVEAGAHALFMPHGLGHMLGLDVHDMENLGEDHVGYDETVRRSDQFGLRSLRFGRAPQPGFVLTVEPGLYFIPALIDQWRAERRCADHLDYAVIERFRDAGGIRIEDNVVVTGDGCRVLGPSIPKAMTEVEELLRA